MYIFRDKLNSFDLEKLALWIVRIGIFLTLLTPLIYTARVMNPTIFPKVIWFRSVVELILPFYVLLLFLNWRKWHPRFSWVLVAVFLFFLVLTLSLFSSINPSRSFWGSIEKMEGVVTHLHVFAFFVMLVGVFRKEREWNVLFKTFLGVGVLVFLAGMIQKFGIFDFYGVVSRPSATFGMPNFLGPWLLLPIFVAIFFFFKINGLWKRTVYGVLFLTFLALLVLTQTRSAALGLAAGASLFLVLWSLWDPKTRGVSRKLITVGAILIAVLTAILILFRNIDLPVISDLLLRFREASGLNDRFAVWLLALEAWLQRPFFGWGLESFDFIYVKFFTPIQQNFNFFHNRWDRVHNQFLEFLVAGGIFGGLAYLALFFVPIWSLASLRKKIRFPVVPLFISFLVAYFIQSQFNLEILPITLNIFLVLGFIHSMVLEKDEEPRKRESRETSRLGTRELLASFFTRISFWAKGMVMLFILLVIGVSIVWVNVVPSVAMVLYMKADVTTNQDISRGVNRFYTVFSWKHPTTDLDLRMRAVNKSLALLEKTKGIGRDVAGIHRFLHLVKDDVVRDARKPDIKQVMSYEMASRIFNMLYLLSQDMKWLEEEEKILGEALKFNPNFPQIYQLLGEIRILQGQDEDARVFYSKAYNLDDDLPGLHYRLGIAYLKAGKIREGAFEHKRSLEFAYDEGRFSFSQLIRAAELYEGIDDWQSAIEVYSWGMGRVDSPAAKIGGVRKNDIATLHSHLGKSYLGFGDSTRGAQELRMAFDMRRELEIYSLKDTFLLAAVYEEMDELEEVLKIYTELANYISEDDPERLQLYASLAAVYAKDGQIEKARETALQILEIDPSQRVLVDEFMESLE